MGIALCIADVKATIKTVGKPHEIRYLKKYPAILEAGKFASERQKKHFIRKFVTTDEKVKVEVEILEFVFSSKLMYEFDPKRN